MKHPLSSTWKGMIQRCHYPLSISYKNYGAKGVKVCGRWRKFSNFLEDMGPTWKDGLTLHRLDSSKGYEPGNVVWETWDVQNNNSSHNRLLTLNGVAKPMTMWARELGFSVQTFASRVRYGWSDERILTTPRLR